MKPNTKFLLLILYKKALLLGCLYYLLNDVFALYNCTFSCDKLQKNHSKAEDIAFICQLMGEVVLRVYVTLHNDPTLSLSTFVVDRETSAGTNGEGEDDAC